MAIVCEASPFPIAALKLPFGNLTMPLRGEGGFKGKPHRRHALASIRLRELFRPRIWLALLRRIFSIVDANRQLDDLIPHPPAVGWLAQGVGVGDEHLLNLQFSKVHNSHLHNGSTHFLGGVVHFASIAISVSMAASQSTPGKLPICA